jgi:hypothetical protein
MLCLGAGLGVWDLAPGIMLVLSVGIVGDPAYLYKLRTVVRGNYKRKNLKIRQRVNIGARDSAPVVASSVIFSAKRRSREMINKLEKYNKATRYKQPSVQKN